MPGTEHAQQASLLRTLRATDGVHLRYRVWPSERDTPAATLVLLNGIMSHSAWFEPIVPRLRHLHVVGADRRGSGPNTEARGDAPSAAQLVNDVLAIIEAERVPSRPLVVLGWCWGAALAVAVAEPLRGRLDGLVLVTPGLFPTPTVTDALAAQAGVIAHARVEDPVVETPIREEMFTTSDALEHFIRRDSKRVRWMTPRMLQISRRLAAGAMARVRRLDAPILLVMAGDDEATDNVRTLRAFAQCEAKCLEVVELEGGHGLQFDAPEPLGDRLCAFVEHVTKP